MITEEVTGSVQKLCYLTHSAPLWLNTGIHHFQKRIVLVWLLSNLFYS